MEPVAKRRVHHSRASARCLPPPDGPAAAAPALRGPGPLQAVPAWGQHEAHPQADSQISRHVTDVVRLSPTSVVQRLASRRRRCPVWNAFLLFFILMHLVAI